MNTLKLEAILAQKKKIDLENANNSETGLKKLQEATDNFTQKV